MSKNFELLHNITNEKDLFQTLDGWEDPAEAPVNAEPEEFDENMHARTQQQSPLPDVFQAVDDTMGPLDLATPGLGRLAEPVQKPINEPLEKPLEKSLEKSLEKKDQGEIQSTNLEDRFPMSRNPITRLNSDLDIPRAWVKREIGPKPKDEVELELGQEAPPSIAVPDALPTPERAASLSDTKVQDAIPTEEEKPRHEPPRPRFLGNFGAHEGKSIGDSRAKRSRTRKAYRDLQREAIAHEEELKLVQRIFLAEENSPRMVLFSGFERDTGCASICIRASEILAAQGEGSVCLVDMGLRVPSLHEYCGVHNDRGLAEAIVESSPIQEYAQQLSPPNLWVMPAGYGATQLNFAKVADRLRSRMEELRKTFRYVVVHTGSLWLNADAMLISKWTDGVVLILEAHSTRRDTARRIKESLAAANARVLGVVLNNRTYPIPETLYSRL
jgi:Mrp family chromosome partitioning ATPase